MELIEGVKIKVLKFIPDERGRLMEILRRDDEIFKEFGQVYITTAYPGVIKAWHAHRFQDDNLTVIKGMAKVVLCDLRESSPTYKKINEFFVGEYNPILIHIPKLVWHGFKCISENECIVLNIPTNIYNYENPDELRLPFDTPEIPYNWERRNY
ncbi:MAG: dTDP-4-dehydrorhamnose 3,5-epimerase family protein [Candidatus Omnitrophica bacterium]|nr:dTDP-4-dehydrorhamnose 3,5-epimerase family protein [Candidatus Omnitrophota bacterium]MCM8806738.1 dTDP-4-dehydrorhamnose 3,5-epimerase family protein [Candidatus Omnitrophota bacterium]